MSNQLIIATRGSKLALTQSNWVGDRLQDGEPLLAVALLKIVTKGDKILDVPLAKVGGKGLFVKEIEEALADGRAHAAVHSIKDVPAELPHNLHLAAIPVREDVRDAFISSNNTRLDGLAKGAKVGTSSLRRSAQLLAHRPDLDIVSLRGNVDTRLRKLDEGQMDAIILASAGLHRLGLGDRIVEYIDPEIMLPAVGQGALGIECRLDDTETNERLNRLNDSDTSVRIRAERSFLARLEGGCQVPIGCLSTIDGQELTVTGMVCGLTGSPLIKASRTGSLDRAEDLGREVAEDVLGRGGDVVLAEVYGQ